MCGTHNRRVALPVFGFVTRHQRLLADGIAREAEWMAGCAATGRAVAHLWQGTPGWVVPRSYLRAPGFDAARDRWAARGRPLQVRSSGGGLVPQGPGIVNLSLAWCTPHAMPHGIEPVYQALCGQLSAALARLGLPCEVGDVAGSFCDGRYNLALGGRKIVGTAQWWRRIGAQPVVLAHAVLVVDTDPAALADEANAVEQALERPTRYRAEAMTSIARAWGEAHGRAPAGAGLIDEVQRVVAEQFARVVPPLGVAT